MKLVRQVKVIVFCEINDIRILLLEQNIDLSDEGSVVSFSIQSEDRPDLLGSMYLRNSSSYSGGQPSSSAHNLTRKRPSDSLKDFRQTWESWYLLSPNGKDNAHLATLG